MKKFPITLLYSVVAVAVTVILFFLILVDVDKEEMHYMALGGVVLAELITAAYAIFTKGSPRRLAAVTVSVIMIPLALMLMDGGSRSQNKQQQAARDNVTHLRKLLKCVMLEPAAGPYRMRLRKLDDDLHYTNNSVYVAEDENIRVMLLQLQTGINGPADQVEAQLASLERAVQRRTIMTSRNA